MSIFDTLTSDLDWRESELGSLKILMNRKDISRTQKRVLLRSSWALLYAHYEGFTKFCLTAFYDEASRRLNDCTALPIRTKALALKKDLNMIKNLADFEFLNEVSSFPDRIMATKPDFPEVDTRSNLWPSVMRDLLADADIQEDLIDDNYNKIKTLVSRRNEIAHGKKNLIEEIDYYLTYEEAVYKIMYSLSYAIEDRLNTHPYNNTASQSLD